MGSYREHAKQARKAEVGAFLFLLLEFVMHLYVSVFLTFHWTNWPIYLFTLFETLGFVFLLRTKKGREHEEDRIKEIIHCCCPPLPRLRGGIHNRASGVDHGHPHH